MKLGKLLGSIAVIVLLAFTAACAQTPAATASTVTVYKSPTCDCCTAWIDHLQENGLSVVTKNVDYQELYAMKASYGVSDELASCHTALVDGYVVEGHVPADLIARLLSEQPNVAGLAVPGMPAGSPGMESPNPQPYDVFAFSDDGTASVYAQR